MSVRTRLADLRSDRRFRWSFVVLALTAVVGVGLAVAGVSALYVAAASAFGVFCLGVVLWLFGEDKEFDEIGRAIMVAVPLAVVVGAPQFLIDQDRRDRDMRREAAQLARDTSREAAEKERDFKLSLALQEDLSGADLRGAPLTDVRLWGKNLAAADLTRATLTKARLVSTNLSQANLTGADLTGADLRRARLRGARLHGAKLNGANLAGADMTGASLYRADLRDSDMGISGLHGACLTEADLRRADLAGADLAGAVLTGADVRGARFETDLKAAKLGHAGLAGAVHDTRTAWPIDWPRHHDAVSGRADPAVERWPSIRPPRDAFSATVTEVTDGDTVLLEPLRKRLAHRGRARLLGVDAPFLTSPHGRTAQRFVESRLRHRRVRVSIDRTTPLDPHRRYRVLIWLSDEQSFNELLLEKGLLVSAGGVAEPARMSLWAAELRGKQRGAGLWRTCPDMELNQSAAGR